MRFHFSNVFTNVLQNLVDIVEQFGDEAVNTETESDAAEGELSDDEDNSARGGSGAARRNSTVSSTPTKAAAPAASSSSKSSSIDKWLQSDVHVLESGRKRAFLPVAHGPTLYMRNGKLKHLKWFLMFFLI